MKWRAPIHPGRACLEAKAGNEEETDRGVPSKACRAALRCVHRNHPPPPDDASRRGGLLLLQVAASGSHVHLHPSVDRMVKTATERRREIFFVTRHCLDHNP